MFYGTEWKRKNREKHNAQNRKSYQKNKEKYKVKRAKYFQNNKEHIMELQTKRRKYQTKRTKLSPEIRKLNINEKRRMRYKLNPMKYIERVHVRRRQLGFNKLNKPFCDSVWHHINDKDVVAIPKKIHIKFAHVTREKHRKLILSYYKNIENMILNQPGY